ncbi:MAG: lipoate--protein ligase family protein [Candidatus Altiarchaeales archaeon]|nr:MAG: lipoate--protein ligase family protein [Candidatus Altiarchaeales archaeon]
MNNKMDDELRFIDFGITDVYRIMAENEALFRIADRSGENIGFIWIPEKSINMGYSQLIERELNLERCKKLNYQITRRISGGGMAFASEKSQVQYGFIGNLEDSDIPVDMIESYRRICNIIIYALERYGLKGEFKPINDVLCNGKKISGSAQTRGNRVLLQHGTILVNFNIKEMLLCCNIPLEKISDKGIKSVEERITDLNRELKRNVPLDDVKDAMRYGFEKTFNVSLREGKMTDEERKLADKLLPKYRDENWIFRYTKGRTRSAGLYKLGDEVREFMDSRS